MSKPSILLVTLAGLCALLATQCRSSEDATENTPLERYDYQQSLMGTHFNITIYTNKKYKADEAAEEAYQFADKVNGACSDYDVTSELMRLNAASTGQAFPVSPLLLDVLDSAISISQKTEGAYDPTLGHHSYNWRMARKKGILPSQKRIDLAKAASGYKHLQLDSAQHTVTKLVNNMRLDLGGIAKGYAAEKMLAIIQRHGIKRASVTAGGEVRLGNPPPSLPGWEVTLKTLDTEHQLSPQVLHLSNCAISTSGDIHQSITIDGQRYSHVVNPNTGLGLTRRISATVIGKNATIADALATALCVQPDLKFPHAETLVILENQSGQLESICSKNWHSFPK